MKGLKIKKSAFVIILCALMVILAVSVSASTTWNWTDEGNTVGYTPVEHKHIYGEWVVDEAPTCNSTGLRHRTCLFADGTTACGKVYTEVLPEDPYVHADGTETVVKAASCSGVGESVFTCSSCGKKETVYTEALEHTFDKSKETVIAPIHDPTREMPGSIINSCTVCNELIRETLPVVHTFEGEGSVTMPATCSKKGSQLKYCTVCKKAKMVDVEIDPTNHVYSGKALPIGTVDCVKGGRGIVICEDCGETVYVDIPADKAHEYLEWDYTKAKGDCQSGTDGSIMKECGTCKKVFESRFWSGHVLGDDARTHAATCSDYGYMKGTCTICLREDAEVIIPVDPSAHSWEEEVLIEPTCTTKGYVFRMCKYDSSHVEYTDIPEIGHTFVTDWNIEKEATCYEKGIRNNICIVCNELISEFIPINPDNHPIDESLWQVRKEPSCSEAGIEAAYCKWCVRDDDLVYREIPKHSNTLIEYSRTKATCKLEGQIVYDCYECGADVIETLPVDLDAHKPGATYYVTKNATCYEEGVLSKLCDYCMNPIIASTGQHAQKPIEKKDHIVGAWTVTKAATCKENGSKTRKCTVENCRYSETVDIPASHRYEAWVVEIEGTCKSVGKRTRGCYNCSLSETDYYYGTHQAGDWIFYKGNCNEGGTVRKYCKYCELPIEEDTVSAGEHVGLVEVDDFEFKPTESVCQRRAYKCSACKETLYVTAGHAFIKTDNAFAATCTVPGMTAGYYCPLCKIVVKQEVIPATGHDFEYDEEGTKYCLNCTLYYVEGGTSETCDHFCHNKGTIAKIMTKFFTFFWKILDKFSVEPKYQYCECGLPHYELKK